MMYPKQTEQLMIFSKTTEIEHKRKHGVNKIDLGKQPACPVKAFNSCLKCYNPLLRIYYRSLS